MTHLASATIFCIGNNKLHYCCLYYSGREVERERDGWGPVIDF